MINDIQPHQNIFVTDKKDIPKVFVVTAVATAIAGELDRGWTKWEGNCGPHIVLVVLDLTLEISTMSPIHNNVA